MTDCIGFSNLVPRAVLDKKPGHSLLCPILLVSRLQADDMPPPPPPEDDSPFDAPMPDPAPAAPQQTASAVPPSVAATPSAGLVTLPNTGMTPPQPHAMGAPAATPQAAPGLTPATGNQNPTLNRSPSSMLAPRVSWAAPLNDLISTEQEYIQLVMNAANAYDANFKASAARLKKALSEPDMTSISALFSGLSLVAKCHSQFLPHIEAARAGTEPLGGAIKTMVITLKVYTNYMTDLDAKIEVLRKSRKNKEFSKFLDECKAKIGSHQEIESICAHTYKRLGQYEGLINAFLVNMTPSDPDYNEVKESQQLVRKVVEYIAQARSDLDSRNKIIVIQQRVASLPSNLNLVAPHRFLVREQDMDVRPHDAKKSKDMCVYAFNDMILLTRTKGLVSKEEVCEAIISYHDHRIELTSENDRSAFKMVDAKKGSGYIFLPPDDANRNTWVSEIKGAIEQLKNSRATTLVDQVDENELQTKLQVRVIAGRDLVQTLYEPPDLYVQVSLGAGTNTRKSAIRDKCRFNPDWEDKFVLSVKNPYEDVLNVEVKDNSGDSVLAQTSIPLDDLYDHVEKLGWFKLTSQMANGQLEPELLLGLMVAPTLNE